MSLVISRLARTGLMHVSVSSSSTTSVNARICSNLSCRYFLGVPFLAIITSDACLPLPYLSLVILYLLSISNSSVAHMSTHMLS